MHLPDCIFCQIAKGEAPSFKIWEDDDFMAFLNIFPNTKGASLVIPKQHYDSYFAEIPEDVLEELMEASQKVAKLLDEKLEDVGRTGLIFEGFGVNHIHAKLFPMHGTKLDEWKNIESDIDDYYETYPGYLSSHSAKRASDVELKKVAEQITN